jgi:hypothetical protein
MYSITHLLLSFSFSASISVARIILSPFLNFSDPL